MGLVGAQVTSAKATVTNAISTQSQIAAINSLHTNMMLLRMTKTHYIALAKQAVASTVAYTRSLAGLARGVNASTAAAAMHNKAIAVGNLAQRAPIASCMLATNAIKFLSHLCGGEATYKSARWVRLFLSHLCGGEVSLWGKCINCSFLSHLCGGEEQITLTGNIVIFLSHLCGGEAHHV